MDNCPSCGAELEITSSSFTGVCNHGKGQYIIFYYCPNEECIRYHLYVKHHMSERR